MGYCLVLILILSEKVIYLKIHVFTWLFFTKSQLEYSLILIYYLSLIANAILLYMIFRFISNKFKPSFWIREIKEREKIRIFIKTIKYFKWLLEWIIVNENFLAKPAENFIYIGNFQINRKTMNNFYVKLQSEYRRK